jgi:hypothetical protein
MADTRIRRWLRSVAPFLVVHGLDAVFWTIEAITWLRTLLGYGWGALRKAGKFITAPLGLGP